METNMNTVPDLSYEDDYALAHEKKEVLINGARIIFDKKAPLTPVKLEDEQKKKYERK
jgi:hypothetical protein